MATPPPVDTNNPRLESINRIKPGPRRYSNNQGQKQKAESISRSRTRARKTKPTHLLTGGGGGQAENRSKAGRSLNQQRQDRAATSTESADDLENRKRVVSCF